MSAYQVAWLMRLLESNARLRRQLATLKTDKRILVEVSRQFLSTSATRRASGRSRQGEPWAFPSAARARSWDNTGRPNGKIPKLIGRSQIRRSHQAALSAP